MRILSVTELPVHLRADVELQLKGLRPGSNPPPRGDKPLPPPNPPKRSKFGNTRVTIDGETYDSRAEYLFHELLKLRKRRGEIGLILRQVPFRLEGGVIYKADYLVEVFAGPPNVEVWDVKGCDTQPSINKRKQVLARYGIEVRLWRS
jgi:hypothetical protein